MISSFGASQATVGGPLHQIDGVRPPIFTDGNRELAFWRLVIENDIRSVQFMVNRKDSS